MIRFLLLALLGLVDFSDGLRAECGTVWQAIITKAFPADIPTLFSVWEASILHYFWRGEVCDPFSSLHAFKSVSQRIAANEDYSYA